MGRIVQPRTGGHHEVSPDTGMYHRDPMSPGYRRFIGVIAPIAAVGLIGFFIACGNSDKSCSSGDSGCGEDGKGWIQRFVEARGQADFADCECRAERGWVGDVDACMDEILPATDNLLTCLQLVADEQSGVRANLECASEAEKGLAKCLDKSSCTRDEYDACFDSYRKDYEECRQIEQSDFRELNDCF